MTTTLSPNPVFRSWDNSGNPLVGGQLFTYAAGTTTPLATYTDSTGSTPNTNPVILNSRGEANVWMPPNVAFKLVLQDSLGNGIWTVDQIINNQLLTLYGGVDTGVANAYVLNFAAPYTGYVDGTVIYFLPANTNTSTSTINVNGFGAIPIVNQTGVALSASQIIANQMTQIIIRSGQAYLLTSPAQNSFFISNASTGEIGVLLNGVPGGNFFSTVGSVVSVTVTGVTGVPSVLCGYTLNLNVATLFVPAFSGTGAGTSFLLGLAQTNLFTPNNRPQWMMIPSAQDNGSNLYAQTASILNTGGSPPTGATITINKNGNPAGWVATGTRGLGDSAAVSGGYYIPISWITNGSA